MNFKKKLMKKYSLTNKKKLIFLLRRLSENSLSYRDIEKEIPNKPCNTSKLLSQLIEDMVVNIEVVNKNCRSGTKNKYRLSTLGEHLADDLVFSGLTSKEKELLILLKILGNGHPKLLKDFWDVISLFQDHGLKKDVSDFSEIITNLMKMVKKFFKYETQFNQSLVLEGDTVLE